MKMMVTLVPLLVAFIMGAQPGEASTDGTVASVSTFLDEHASDYLAHVKSHFDNSLKYLFTGNAFGDQSVQRPGLAKVLKEESDRHWNLGIDALKKYLQRGGRTPATPQTTTAKPQTTTAKPQTTTAKPQASTDKSKTKEDMGTTFKESFDFQGKSTLDIVHKNSVDFNGTYLLQCETLVTDCHTTVVKVNNLHRMSMNQTKDNHKTFDADMAHYLEEKLEKEVGLMRKFSNLYTSLKKMSSLGLAQHIFDKSLSD